MQYKRILVILLSVLLSTLMTNIVSADENEIGMNNNTNDSLSMTTIEASDNEDTSINNTAKIKVEGHVEGYEMEKEKVIPPSEVDSCSFSRIDMITSMFVIVSFGVVVLVGAIAVIAIYTISRRKRDK